MIANQSLAIIGVLTVMFIMVQMANAQSCTCNSFPANTFKIDSTTYGCNYQCSEFFGGAPACCNCCCTYPTINGAITLDIVSTLPGCPPNKTDITTTSASEIGGD